MSGWCFVPGSGCEGAPLTIKHPEMELLGQLPFQSSIPALVDLDSPNPSRHAACRRQEPSNGTPAFSSAKDPGRGTLFDHKNAKNNKQ